MEFLSTQQFCGNWKWYESEIWVDPWPGQSPLNDQYPTVFTVGQDYCFEKELWGKTMRPQFHVADQNRVGISYFDGIYMIGKWTIYAHFYATS